MSELNKETLRKIIQVSTQTGMRIADAKRDFDAEMNEIEKSASQQIEDLMKEEA